MKNIIYIITLLLISNLILAQETPTITLVDTDTEEIQVLGEWQKLNTTSDSGQRFLMNSDTVIIAVAQNKKIAYPFYEKGISDFELVEKFHQWDTDWLESNNTETKQLKKDKKKEYIIWKYNDGTSDNVFLFGSSKDNFLNLLVYTEKWTEEEKIQFLEQLYELNKE